MIALPCHVGLLARGFSARPSHMTLMHVCLHVSKPRGESVSTVIQVSAGSTAICATDYQHRFKKGNLAKNRWSALLHSLYAGLALALPARAALGASFAEFPVELTS